MADNTAAARQGLVTVVGIPGYWATKSGGNVTAATTDVWNGGATEAEKLAAPPTTADVKVDRPFSPVRDQPLLRELRKRVGSWRTTVSFQPTDADLTPIGDPDVYADALLTTLDPPDYDASSGNAQRWGLTFAVSGTA